MSGDFVKAAQSFADAKKALAEAKSNMCQQMAESLTEALASTDLTYASKVGRVTGQFFCATPEGSELKITYKTGEVERHFNMTASAAQRLMSAIMRGPTKHEWSVVWNDKDGGHLLNVER